MSPPISILFLGVFCLFWTLALPYLQGHTKWSCALPWLLWSFDAWMLVSSYALDGILQLKWRLNWLFFIQQLSPFSSHHGPLMIIWSFCNLVSPSPIPALFREGSSLHRHLFAWSCPRIQVLWWPNSETLCFPLSTRLYKDPCCILVPWPRVWWPALCPGLPQSGWPPLRTLARALLHSELWLIS